VPLRRHSCARSRSLQSHSPRYRSQLVHLLRRLAWVPQDGGSFVRPSAASRSYLPEKFPFDSGQQWLNAVRFGEDVVRRSEEQQQKQAVAKELGFADDESLERARRFASLPREDQERILADQDRRAAVELPDREPANPARRAEGIAAHAAEAPDRITEERTRSVSIGREAVKEEAAQYLCQQYTIDGDVICQICKTPMPFKLDDGTDYFEKVEFCQS
jgi:glycine/D-amino acid oxidase-like deaminating enzyme